MPSHQEQDPLLPKNERAPEISSRPGSLNNLNEFQDLNTTRDRKTSAVCQRFSRAGLALVILAIVFTVAQIAIGNWDGKDDRADDHPERYSFDERASHILKGTPLIGMLC